MKKIIYKLPKICYILSWLCLIAVVTFTFKFWDDPIITYIDNVGFVLTELFLLLVPIFSLIIKIKFKEQISAGEIKTRANLVLSIISVFSALDLWLLVYYGQGV